MSAARKVRRTEEELTPEARLERAARQITAGLVLAIQAELARTGGASDRVDQTCCKPFARKQYLRLAAAGEFPTKKIGRRVTVLRSDLNAYIDRKGLARGRRIEDEDEDDILEEIVRGRRA